MRQTLKRIDRSFGTRAARAGFTFVELMVGVVLLAILITALAGSSIYSSRMMTKATSRLETVHFLQTELEYLLNMPYDSLASGSRTSDLGTSKWSVQDSFAYSKILLRVSYAPTGGDPIQDSLVMFRQAP